MNKVLIKLYVPALEKKYDIWIPINKKVKDVINLIVSGIDSLNKINIKEEKLYLYNKSTAEVYCMKDKIIDTNIRNATELILI